MGRAPGTARRDPQGAGSAGAQTRGRVARHVERRAGVPVASFGGIGVGRGIRCFSELPPSPSGNGGKGLPRGRDGVGRERGYPLGARGSPCDADYEDGSVPLQLPLSCADHCIEARREGCHLREIGRVSSSGRHQPASVRISSRPTELSVGPRLRRQALRLRRTAYAAAGLDRSARPNERHPCLDRTSMPIAPLAGECATVRHRRGCSGPLD